MRASIFGLLVSSAITAAAGSASADKVSTAPQTGFGAFGGSNDSPHADFCLEYVGTPAAHTSLNTVQCGAYDTDNPQAFRYTSQHQIVPTYASYLCVDVDNGAVNPSTQVGGVHLEPCNGTAAQSWTYSSGQLKSAITTGSGNYCLDVTDAEGNNGVDVTTCNHTIAQVWWPSGFLIQLQSDLCDVASGVPCLSPTEYECLDLQGDNPAVNTQLDNTICTTANDAQNFTIWNNTITNHDRCAGISSFTGNTGAVEMQACNGSEAQTWWFDITPAGLLEVQNELTPNGTLQCLDVHGDSTTPDTLIDTYICGSANTAQIWNPIIVPN